MVKKRKDYYILILTHPNVSLMKYILMSPQTDHPNDDRNMPSGRLSLSHAFPLFPWRTSECRIHA